MSSMRVGFDLYYPETGRETALSYIQEMPGVGIAPYAVIKGFLSKIKDYGEINPHYTGFAEMPGHLVLYMTDSRGRGVGIMVLVPERRDLIRIDLILLKEEYRGMGLGKYLYGYFENAVGEGTILYVDHVTFYGKKFFKKCGFAHDVDLIKVVAGDNRVATAPEKVDIILKACI